MARVALVTGAGLGSGRAVAKRLAADGCSVAVNYRSSAEAAQSLVDEITAAGGKALAFAGDVSSSEAVKKLFDDVKESLGPVEILVNNAGQTKDGLLMRMKDADWDDVLDADLSPCSSARAKRSNPWSAPAGGGSSTSLRWSASRAIPDRPITAPPKPA